MSTGFPDRALAAPRLPPHGWPAAAAATGGHATADVPANPLFHSHNDETGMAQPGRAWGCGCGCRALRRRCRWRARPGRRTGPDRPVPRRGGQPPGGTADRGRARHRQDDAVVGRDRPGPPSWLAGAHLPPGPAGGRAQLLGARGPAGAGTRSRARRAAGPAAAGAGRGTAARRARAGATRPAGGRGRFPRRDPGPGGGRPGDRRGRRPAVAGPGHGRGP